MKYRIIWYDDLIKKLSFLSTDPQGQTKFTVDIKELYTMVKIPTYDYHITIYKYQWDDFRTKMNFNYYLFHISSETTVPKCSTYFWVDMENNLIKKIPTEHFSYGQDKFGMNSSTRQPCNYELIQPVIKKFQKILLYVANLEKTD